MADFIALVTYYTQEQGGRKAPIGAEYNPVLKFEGLDVWAAAEQEFVDKDMVFPGESIATAITILTKDPFVDFLYEGQNFELTEAREAVASGVIMEVVNWELKSRQIMRKLANEELNRLSAEEFINADKRKLVIILDNVRSLNNVGSVFRTADAFLVEAIYLCGITGTPPNKEIYKTALGADETVAWKYVENTMQAVDDCRQKGYAVFAVEQAEGSTMLNDFMPPANGLALVFGNEVNGVLPGVVDAADGCIEIPQDGSKHSLNISVSVGIVVWQVVVNS